MSDDMEKPGNLILERLRQSVAAESQGRQRPDDGGAGDAAGTAMAPIAGASQGGTAAAQDMATPAHGGNLILERLRQSVAAENQGRDGPDDGEALPGGTAAAQDKPTFTHGGKRYRLNTGKKEFKTKKFLCATTPSNWKRLEWLSKRWGMPSPNKLVVELATQIADEEYQRVERMKSSPVS